MLLELQSWLRGDDMLCFWSAGSEDVLQSMYRLVLKTSLTQRMVILTESVRPLLTARNMEMANAYAICAAFGAAAEEPRHRAENDVLAMQKALKLLHAPAMLLPGERATQKTQQCGSAAPVPAPDARLPYLFDRTAGRFHKAGCSEIPAGAALTGYPDLKKFFRKKLRACPHCRRGALFGEIRAYNRDRIAHMQDPFLYLERSEVFHLRTCSAMLSTSEPIRGAQSYGACIAIGLRPCKLCTPTPDAWPDTAQRKGASIPDRCMTTKELCAYDRYLQARSERLTAIPERFASDAAKNDFFTLTQPRFAFFSAAGYQNFHRRNCQKLHGLSGIAGFPTYRAAVRSGHTPCKLCKPTAKLDMECSIPISNHRRSGESARDLEALCRGKGYPFERKEPFFCFSTPVGKWKIDLSSTPYIVYHINLVHPRGNGRSAHRQPRLFLSLADAFHYIDRHDGKLLTRQNAGTPTLSGAAD